jgi:hypothetical protein
VFAVCFSEILFFPRKNRPKKSAKKLLHSLRAYAMMIPLTAHRTETKATPATRQKERTMNAKTISSNEWAKNMTAVEVANWIEAMIECNRTESTGYGTERKMVRCPFNKPLAIV